MKIIIIKLITKWKLKLYKVIAVLELSYGCELWTTFMKEESEVQASKNGVLKRS